MLSTVKEMMSAAKKGGYAVGAFNIENMEMAQAVVFAAEEMESAVILQTTPSTVRYAGIKLLGRMLSALAEEAKVPVAVHLDHGADLAMVEKAANAGYSSIMIDGSRLDFEKNITLTKQAAKICSVLGIPLEAELGAVGGKEDDAVSGGLQYTDPGEAGEFVRRTGVFSLAVGIGTSHGIYSGPPKLDIARVGLIAKTVEIPLVLHGTSGVPEADVSACINQGICKVNYATDLRLEFTKGVKEAISESPDAYDPKIYLSAGRERVKQAAKRRIFVCNNKYEMGG